jgi:hypothetical protein
MATQKPRQTPHRPPLSQEIHVRGLEDSWIILSPETPSNVDFTHLTTPEGHRKFLERERKALAEEDKLYREAIEYEIEQNRLGYEYIFRTGGPWLEEDNWPYPIRQARDSKGMIGNLVGFFEKNDKDRR